MEAHLNYHRNLGAGRKEEGVFEVPRWFFKISSGGGIGDWRSVVAGWYFDIRASMGPWARF